MRERGIVLEGVAKAFGRVRAVDGVDLAVRGGEFFSLLGPSGSGKTTLLRLIAGFERPDAGRVLLGEEDVGGLPPFERDVNTVFQDYALFPHMTVAQNVEYGLRVKRVPKPERRQRAEQALDSVRLAGYGGRKPGELSGGQRQRVALARALVNRPAVLLLDEPLGALDRRLRQEMQGELKELQRSAGITFLLVTHDQEEALTMSDRIALLDAGRIVQVGTPTELYERPASPFAAEFVGTANLLRGAEALKVLGRSGVFALRPERIQVLPHGEPGLPGRVVDSVFAGAHTRVTVELEATGVRLLAQGGGAGGALVGAPVALSWHEEHVVQLEGAR